MISYETLQDKVIMLEEENKGLKKKLKEQSERMKRFMINMSEFSKLVRAESKQED